jgi:copper chaperone CopZ
MVMRRLCLLLGAALLALQVPFSRGMCANACSGHGECNHYDRCECWSGFAGGDCSERMCPMGLAWSDQATAVDTAHGQTECSNRGLCARKEGRCSCMPGFSGAACDRTTCPNNNFCSGHGSCSSMKSFAEQYRDGESIQHAYGGVWEAESLHRCICDAGYTGYDCSLRTCPVGDDPLTEGQVNEVQLVVCQATSGTWALVYEDQVSGSMTTSSTADEVKIALETIPGVPSVTVTFSEPSRGACEIDIVQVISVEFTQNFGPLRPMWTIDRYLTPGGVDPGVIVTADGSSIQDSNGVWHPSIKGTKESDVCSARGSCDSLTGTCDCFSSNSDIFASSDGVGAAGTRGDCGHAVTPTAGCPGEIACSGHGSCDLGAFRCTCEEGWTSGDCSLRTCPSGRSWFSYPSADDRGHDQWTECSDAGICNRESGKCTCGNLFKGAACEDMVCPGEKFEIGAQETCSGHGICMTMAELALHSSSNGVPLAVTYGADPNNALTWDAHRVFGCLCDKGFEGFDCSERMCPTGDDPGTWGQAQEVQLIQCNATSGSVPFTFRGATTVAIQFDADAEEVEAAIEALYTVDDVTVEFGSGSVFCDTGGSNIAAITFTTQHGDVPTLEVDDSGLTGGGIEVRADGEAFGPVQSFRGTTEEDVCSNRGLCDRTTGQCLCFRGWAGSNGAGGVGDRNDCGYRIRASTGLRTAMGGAEEYSFANQAQDIAAVGQAFANGAYKDMAMVAIFDVAQKNKKS